MAAGGGPALDEKRKHGLRFASRATGVAIVALALGAAALTDTGTLRAARDAAAPPRTLTVGTQQLTQCSTVPLGYCGYLRVPLDRLHPSISPRIAIKYELYPADAGRDPRPRGTVLPVEGGPGYSSIGSVYYASGIGSGVGGYAPTYGPLLRQWNLLSVDLRGTGGSAAIDCPHTQHLLAPAPSLAFENLTAACAAYLNRKWRYSTGARVHASDMFTSAPAAQDVAAVLDALRISRVDLYGDSYGSWFSQVFASRYPQRLRSLILDSTYPTVHLRPWYASTVRSMPRAFDAACARWPACAQANLTGSPWERVGQVAQLLRAHPIAGTVPGPHGQLTKAAMGVAGLVNIVNDAASDSIVYQLLDAADRALLRNHDPAPLLRLYEQRLAYDENYIVPATTESEGLYLAVACLDYKQLFDMRDSPGQRARQFAAAQRRLPARTFAPFTTREWLSIDENTETYDACLKWPSPTTSFQPPIIRTPPLLPKTVPVLVLGGEFDTLTPPVDHPRILAYLGGHSRFILVANSTHVVGENSTVCGTRLIREFVHDPTRPLNASCAPQAPPLHLVGVYAASPQQEPPLTGTAASVAARQLAAAAVQTAGDAFMRLTASVGNHDTGLHGGTVTVSRQATLITLTQDQLIPGVAVSGTITLRPASNPLDDQELTARLTTTGGGAFTARWTDAGAGAIATVTGIVDGQPVSGTMPAP